MLDGIRAYLREIKHTKKSHKGNFYKKFLLNPQKLLLFGNIVAKERKVLREIERSFTKDLSKFSDHKTIASCLNAPMYFAHPHCPWKRFIRQIPTGRTRGLLRFASDKNYIWIKKWLTAIVSLKAVPWAVFPEENQSNVHRSIPRGLPSKT